MLVCRACGEQFAAAPGGACPECGGQLVYNPYASVQTVAEAVRVAEELQREKERLEGVNAFIIELPDEAVPEQRDGRFIFSSHELIRAGFNQRLKENDLVRVAGLVFEILGYSYTGRVYIARPFSVTPPDYVPAEWLPKPKRARRKKEES